LFLSYFLDVLCAFMVNIALKKISNEACGPH